MVRKAFTKEEHSLMSIRQASTSPAVFFGNAFAAAVLPVYLFLAVQRLELQSNIIVFGIVTAVAAYLIQFAYKNVAKKIKSRIAQARDAAIRSSSANQQDVFDKINVAAENESVWLSIFYNNTLFLLVTLVSVFIVFPDIDLTINYGVSVLLASGVVAFVSTGSN